MIYGAGTWRLTTTLESKLKSAQRAMERRLRGVQLTCRKRAFWIREQTWVEGIVVEIKKDKWTWAGRVVRRNDSRWTARETEWIPRDGTKRRSSLTRHRADIRKFRGKEWVRATQYWSGSRSMAGVSCSRLLLLMMRHTSLVEPRTLQKLLSCAQCLTVVRCNQSTVMPI